MYQFVHQSGHLITFRASTEQRSSIHFLGYGQLLVELWIGLQHPYSCIDFPTQSDNDEVQSSFFACCYNRSRKLELYISTYLLFLVLKLFRFFLNQIHQLFLQSIFILRQPILLPGIVKDVRLEVVTLHATFKESSASLVVWFLFKFEGSAVFHEFLEFSWLSAA